MKTTLTLCLLAALALASDAVAQTIWTALPSVGAPRRAGAWMFAFGDTVYTGGGVDSTESNVLKDWYAYSVSGHAWSSMPVGAGVGKPVMRAFGAACQSRGQAFLGLGIAGATGASSDWYSFDPGTKTWTSKTPFPAAARSEVFAFAIGDTVYIGGGIDGSGHPLNDFWGYNVVTDQWSQLPKPPFDSSSGATTFAIGENGYVACGRQHLFEPQSTLWQYNAHSHSWQQKRDFYGSPRFGAAGFAVNGHGFVISGGDQYGSAYDGYEYDPTIDDWYSVESIPTNTARMYSSAAVTGGKAYVAFGRFFDGQTRTYYSDAFLFTPPPQAVSPRDAADAITMYPNPASRYVRVEGLGQRASFVVTNSLGVHVLRGDLDAQNVLDLGALPPGVYQVNLTNGGSHYVRRLVKQ